MGIVEELVKIWPNEVCDTCVCFDLIIDKMVSRPFCFAGAVPEVDFIPAVFAEVGFDCRG